MVQTKEEIAIKRKARYEANKEEIAIKGKNWREANKEKISIKDKTKYEANKDRILEKSKTYYEANKEAVGSRHKVYNKTPAGRRRRILSRWKQIGAIGDLKTFYDERYIPATQCEVCEKVFKSTRDRCMDHCHTTGEIRWVLCQSCNRYDYWKKVLARKEEDILP